MLPAIIGSTMRDGSRTIFSTEKTGVHVILRDEISGTLLARDS
jgi:hypothetical protein